MEIKLKNNKNCLRFVKNFFVRMMVFYKDKFLSVEVF